MNQAIKLTFVGDMLCQQQQLKKLDREGVGYDTVFEKVKPLFHDSDYVIGNLETPVAPSQRLSHELMCFNAPIDFIAAMKRAGIDFVSTANNHIWDRGPKGLDETLKSLRLVGLDTTGAYDQKDDADKIFVKEIGGMKVAIVACTYETNFGRPHERMTQDLEWKVDLLKKPLLYPDSFWFPIRRALSNLLPMKLKSWIGRIRSALRSARRSTYCAECVPACEIDKPEHEPYRLRVENKIKRAKEKFDFVIVLPHVGGQHNPSPGRYHEYTMQWMAEAGADLIVSGHAHVPQKAFCMQDGTFAAYCLGDFVFSMVEDRFNTGFETNASIVLNVYIDCEKKKIVRVNFVPCLIPEGTACPCPLIDLYRNAKESEREKLEIDNETIVRSVRGGVLPVRVQSSYEIPIETPLI